MLIRDFNFLQSNENVHLSVILMADSFFYAVIDQNQRLLAHASFLSVRYSDPVSIRAIHEDSLLKAEYASVHVYVFNPWQVQFAFQDEDMLRMLPAMHQKEISKHTLPGTSGIAYFAITDHQYALIESLFENKNFTITNVVQLFANHFKDKPGKIMHLHVEEDTIHLYMQKDFSFLFYNQLVISGGHDVLYFVIALCEENHWNPADVSITISGWIISDHSIINLLKTYFPNCKMVEMDAFSLPIELDPTIRPSCYFAHYAGRSCA